MSKQTIFESLGMVMAFLGIGVAYFAIHLGIRQDRYKRELEHKERMRALELGRSLPGDQSWLSPLRIGFLTGVIVPVSAMGFAWLSSLSMGYNGEVWRSSGIVSLSAILCGTLVTCFAAAKQFQPQGDAVAMERKPVIEEDAYDVVSARG